MTSEAVELWLVGLEALADPLCRLETRDALCPPGELEPMDGTRRIARMALRRLLARTFGRTQAMQPLVPAAHGKPSIPGLPGDFNVSHTSVEGSALMPSLAGNRTVALIGLGRVAAIGVDIEPMKPVRIDQRRRKLILDAASAVGSGDPLPELDAPRMLQAWARLEAWGKADGRGIGRTLTHFGIRGSVDVSLNVAAQQGCDGIWVHDLPVGSELFAAVALPTGVARPSVKVLPSDPIALDSLLHASGGPPNSGVDLAPGAGQKGPHRSVAQPG